MDTKLSKDLWIQADQIQSVNTVLILILVPIFNWIIYPMFEKCNLFKRQLSRMALGMFLAGLSFCASAIVESAIQNTFMNKNSAPHTIEITNLAPFSMNISKNDGFFQIIESFNKYDYTNINDLENTFKITYNERLTPLEFNFSSSNDKYLKNNYLIYFIDNIIKVKPLFSSIKNPPTAATQMRILFLNVDGASSKNYEFKSEPEIPQISINNLLDDDMNESYVQTDPSLFSFKFINIQNETRFLEKNFILGNGESCSFILIDNLHGLDLVKIVDINEYHVSFGYQMIQYFLVTCAEVLFSISGISFAYSQAPESMKSVLQAAWLLTVGFGNIIVIIVAEAHFFENESYEYLLFAVLIFLFTIIFGIMSYFYIYNDNPESATHEMLSRKEGVKSSDIQLIRVNALESNN